MSRDFVIFRVQKLSSRAMGHAIRHLEKHSDSAEISRPELSEKNTFGMNQQEKNNGYRSVLKEKIKKHNADPTTKRALRKDAAVGAEMIFSFTPGAEIDIKEFTRQIPKFLHEEFKGGFQAFAIAEHYDEDSYHVHVIGWTHDPENTSKISAKACLGGPKEFRQHQTNIAEKVAHLGLKRGIPKAETKKRHKTKSEWLREQKVEEYYPVKKESLADLTKEALKAVGYDER